MKTIRVTFVVSALAVLGGCMVVPVAPGPYAGPPRYYVPAPAYYAPSIYYAPAPAYYVPPAYYSPSIGVGIYGGWRGYARGYGRGYGYR